VTLDDLAPRDLHIASFQVSPAEIREVVREVTGAEFRMQQLSSFADFAESIKKQSAGNQTVEHELNAKWQQARYMYSMLTTQHGKLDNLLFPGISWTTAAEYISYFVK